MEEKKQHKQLGFIDCLGIGIGQIIGSGGIAGHTFIGLHKAENSYFHRAMWK